jgi:hypothetical protein
MARCWCCGRVHRNGRGLFRCWWREHQRNAPGTLPAFNAPPRYRAFVLRAIRWHRRRAGLSLAGWDQLTVQG